MDSNFFRPKIIVPKLYLKLEFDTEDQVLFKQGDVLQFLHVLVHFLQLGSSSDPCTDQFPRHLEFSMDSPGYYSIFHEPDI